jgi:hypothetical protein
LQLHFPPILYISIPFLAAVLILKSLMPKVLGHSGESIVRSRLSAKYVVLNNLLIPNTKSKSGTSQIDHVVVSPYGVLSSKLRITRGKSKVKKRPLSGQK